MSAKRVIAEPIDTSLLAPDVLVKIETGEYRIAGLGKIAGKPVVVNATTGRWVKGSGRPAAANDPVEVGKVHGFKHSRGYTEALERFLPAERADSSVAVMSLEELLVAARRMTVETTAKVKAVCPECSHNFEVTTEGRPDSKVLTFLIERLVGAAKKTEEINLHSEELVRVLSDQTILHKIDVVGISPDERADRIRAVKDAG